MKGKDFGIVNEGIWYILKELYGTNADISTPNGNFTGEKIMFTHINIPQEIKEEVERIKAISIEYQ